jgi:hypothetical protein
MLFEDQLAIGMKAIEQGKQGKLKKPAILSIQCH